MVILDGTTMMWSYDPTPYDGSIRCLFPVVSLKIELIGPNSSVTGYEVK